MQPSTELPKRIGRYQVKAEIGRGGMGIVYLAFDPGVERDVAIKVLPLEQIFDETSRVRFKREARIIAALEHEAIVPIYDYGEIYRQSYLVMRYMAGGSLFDRLGRGRLPLQAVVQIISRLSLALDKAHSQGIIHRDIKPANILFDQEMKAYLTDFGIARITEASALLTQNHLTKTGILGTAAYMSPEQVRGEPELDGRSDIYSLGVVLFEMLTGRLPYLAQTASGLAMRHVLDPVPSVITLEPELPEEMDHVIFQAMAKDRDARHQSAAQLAKDLQRVVKQDPSQTKSPSTGAVTTSSRGDEQSVGGKPPHSSEMDKFIEVCGDCGFEVSSLSGRCPQCGSERRLKKFIPRE